VERRRDTIPATGPHMARLALPIQAATGTSSNGSDQGVHRRPSRRTMAPCQKGGRDTATARSWDKHRADDVGIELIARPAVSPLLTSRRSGREQRGAERGNRELPPSSSSAVARDGW